MSIELLSTKFALTQTALNFDNKDMRSNKYLYVISNDEVQSIVFNGLNKSFIFVNRMELEQLANILQTPDRYADTHHEAIRVLSSDMFIVPDDFDEIEFLKAERSTYANSKDFKAVVLPTYDCNFNCWYCTQRHEQSEFTQENQELLVKHLTKYISDNDIETFTLSWFGGEPLLQKDAVIDITKRLKKFCEENIITFNSGITTNGFLMNHETIVRLIDAGISFFQISFDGVKEKHDKVKFDGSQRSAFETVLANIVDFLNTGSNTTMQLRINYTPDVLANSDIVTQICRRIPASIRNRISVDLQKVWQIDADTIDIEKLNEINHLFSEAGFLLTTEHFFSYCYVEKVHHNMYYYNGSVDKCDNNTPKTAKGYINEIGDVVWNEAPLFYDYDILSEESPCRNCDKFPLCKSACVVKREAAIRGVTDSLCTNTYTDAQMEQHIQDFCNRITLNRRHLSASSTWQ